MRKIKKIKNTHGIIGYNIGVNGGERWENGHCVARAAGRKRNFLSPVRSRARSTGMTRMRFLRYFRFENEGEKKNNNNNNLTVQLSRQRRNGTTVV